MALPRIQLPAGARHLAKAAASAAGSAARRPSGAASQVQGGAEVRRPERLPRAVDSFQPQPRLTEVEVNAIVEDGYRTWLGREPDAGGRVNWLNVVRGLDRDGATRAEIRTYVDSHFRASDEYRAALDAELGALRQPAGWPPSIAPRLRDEARMMHRAGVPGIELSARVMGLAAAHYGRDGSLTPAQRSDAAMRDVAAVLLGGSAASNLALMAKLPGKQDPNAARFIEALELLDAEKMVALGDGGAQRTPNLDPTQGDDLRADLRDGTRNQVFHTFAYVFLAYASGDRLKVNAGNLKHETLDPGASVADFTAGVWGAQIGDSLRSARDAGRPNAFADLPAIWGASLSTTPERYGDPRATWNDGVDRRKLAGKIAERVRRDSGNPDGNPFAGALYRLGRWVVAAIDRWREDPKIDQLAIDLGARLGGGAR